MSHPVFDSAVLRRDLAELRELEERLRLRYPYIDHVRKILVTSGLDHIGLDPESSPAELWGRTLEVAAKTHVLDKLLSGIEATLIQVPNDRKIGEAILRVRELTAGAQSSRPLWPGAPGMRPHTSVPSNPVVVPPPGPVQDEDDPQRGRWGSQAIRAGRMLSMTLRDQSDDFFQFDLVVSSIDRTPLVGPIVFHLHDSYARERYWIRKIRDGSRAVLERIFAYGTYTAAAQVLDGHGEWTSLELDLSTLEDVPKRFKRR